MIERLFKATGNCSCHNFAATSTIYNKQQLPWLFGSLYPLPCCSPLPSPALSLCCYRLHSSLHSLALLLPCHLPFPLARPLWTPPLFMLHIFRCLLMTAKMRFGRRERERKKGEGAGLATHCELLPCHLLRRVQLIFHVLTISCKLFLLRAGKVVPRLQLCVCARF